MGDNGCREINVHAEDVENSIFESAHDAKYALKTFLNLEEGKSVLVPAYILNATLRALENVGETNFVVIPSSGGMRRRVYSFILNSDFCYLICKIPNNEYDKIVKVTKKIISK